MAPISGADQPRAAESEALEDRPASRWAETPETPDLSARTLSPRPTTRGSATSGRPGTGDSIARSARVEALVSSRVLASERCAESARQWQESCYKKDLESEEEERRFPHGQSVMQKGFHALMEFLDFTNRRYGNPARTWFKLDAEANMRLGMRQFERRCMDIGFRGNIPALWKYMDKRNTGVVSLLELHTVTAMELARFKLLIRERFRDSATEMFRFLDDNRSGRVNRVTFSARLQTLHYAGKSAKLFEYLDRQGLKWTPSGRGGPRVSEKSQTAEAANLKFEMIVRVVCGALGQNKPAPRLTRLFLLWADLGKKVQDLCTNHFATKVRTKTDILAAGLRMGERLTQLIADTASREYNGGSRRERGKRQAARNLIRRIQIRGLVDRQAARAGKALWLLEQHHSKPKYKLDFQLRERLESSSSMPWKKQYESWQEPTYPAQYWGSWQKSPKPQRAKKEKEDRSKPFLYGHDGKRVEIQDGSFSKSFSSSSHTGPPEDAAKEENKLLKDTIRKLLDQKGTTSYEEPVQRFCERYAAGMEKRNAQLVEQVALLTQTLHGKDIREEANSFSPQYPMRRPMPLSKEDLPADAPRDVDSRSRSPARMEGVKPIELPSTSVEQKLEPDGALSGLSDSARSSVIQQINANPQGFSSMEAVYPLIE
ncbi:Uncharacterized protein SCF082_LOCUS24023 [Durusdinium trenchii]|uniref:Calmodulin n=1 Tax=Durusdinium trenchii TaxID=1381693 RepID=A0ABP0LR18_9DINO